MSSVQNNKNGKRTDPEMGVKAPLYVVVAIAAAATIFGVVRVASGSLSVVGLWPLLPLLAGLAFFVTYFVSGRTKYTLMLPGMALAAVGILAIAVLWFGQPTDYIGGLWPVAIVVLIVGALAAFFVTKRGAG